MQSVPGRRDRRLSSGPSRLFTGEVDTQLPAAGFEEFCHVEGEGVGHDGALEKALAYEIAEVGRLVVEAASGKGLAQFNDALVQVINCGAAGIPPVGVDKNVAPRGREDGVAATEQIKAGVELGHSVFMLGLKESQHVDPGEIDAAHDLGALERAEPLDGEKSFVGADAHDAAAPKGGGVEWVVGSEGRVGVACADEAYLPDGVRDKVFAETLVEREEGRLHRFHEEAVIETGGVQHLVELALIEGGRFFAQNVLPCRQCLDAQAGVRIWMRGDVDGVEVRGDELAIRVAEDGDLEAF